MSAKRIHAELSAHTLIRNVYASIGYHENVCNFDSLLLSLSSVEASFIIPYMVAHLGHGDTLHIVLRLLGRYGDGDDESAVQHYLLDRSGGAVFVDHFFATTYNAADDVPGLRAFHFPALFGVSRRSAFISSAL